MTDHPPVAGGRAPRRSFPFRPHEAPQQPQRADDEGAGAAADEDFERPEIVRGRIDPDADQDAQQDDAQLDQNGLQRAELGEAALEQVGADEGGEPQPRQLRQVGLAVGVGKRLSSASPVGTRLRARGRGLGFDISIEKAADHALVLRTMLRRLGFEKLDALPAEGQGDLHAFLAKRQFGRRGKEVGDHLNLAEGFIGVFYFRAHK
jgi:hypothetical protein